MQDTVYENHLAQMQQRPFIFHMDEQDHRQALFNWHESIELLCCIRGSGYISCDQDTLPMAEGELFVVPSNAVHAVGSREKMEYYCLIVDLDFCRDNGLPMAQLRLDSCVADPVLVQAFGAVAEAFADRQDDLLMTARIRYAVLGLLIDLCSRYVDRTQPEQASCVASERVKKAMVYIRSHLAQSMTLEEIADHVGISKYHFAREFKAMTGETVIDTVNIFRCKEARRLIESGMSVTAAAITCGFENLSYFTRTFKKHFGVIPSAFCPGKRKKEEIS